jgi:hypothetical protein
MKRKIVVNRGDVALIAHSMGCTYEWVSKALNYKSRSALACKIRRVAKMQYGGVEIGDR